jgi:predicted nucleic acid-binding protein
MAVIDTNVLLRYMTDDHDEHSPRALAFLQSIEAGERTAFLPEGVFIETVQLLRSERYATDRAEVRQRFRPLLAMTGIEMDHKRTCELALDIFVEFPRLAIVDCMCAAHAQRHEDQTVITFDRGLRNIPGVVREEP